MKGPSEVYWISESLCILGYYRFAWTIPWLVLINLAKGRQQLIGFFFGCPGIYGCFYSKLHMAPRFGLMRTTWNFQDLGLFLTTKKPWNRHAVQVVQWDLFFKPWCRMPSLQVAGSFGTNNNGLELQLVSCQMDVVEAALRHQPKLSEEAGRVVHPSGGELTPLTQLCTPATNKAVFKVSESYR